MNRVNQAAAIAFSAIGLLASMPPSAIAATMHTSSSMGGMPSATCVAQADKRKLAGAARQSFLGRCMKAVSTPTTKATTLAQNPVSSPSGQTPEIRTNQCASEADRRKLSGAARQSFQHSCLAGAGPVATTGTALQSPSKRQEKSGLGVVSNGQQH